MLYRCFCGKKYNEYVFAIERQNVDTFHSRITIYADADTRNILSREQDVVEGEASSFFSGSTEVVLLSFSDVVNDGSVVRYYLQARKIPLVLFDKPFIRR